MKLKWKFPLIFFSILNSKWEIQTFLVRNLNKYTKITIKFVINWLTLTEIRKKDTQNREHSRKESILIFNDLIFKSEENKNENIFRIYIFNVINNISTKIISLSLVIQIFGLNTKDFFIFQNKKKSIISKMLKFESKNEL